MDCQASEPMSKCQDSNFNMLLSMPAVSHLFVQGFFLRLNSFIYLVKPTNLFQVVGLSCLTVELFDLTKLNRNLLQNLGFSFTFTDAPEPSAYTRKCLQFVFYQNFDPGQKFYTANRESQLLRHYIVSETAIQKVFTEYYYYP